MRILEMVALAIVVGGCTTAAVGSAMPLNMAPEPPKFTGTYDFDLLNGVLRGEECVNRSELDAQMFWAATYNIGSSVSGDKLTNAAIAAAAYKAVNGMDAAIDAFIVTRVVATPKGRDTVCAKISGRGSP